MSTETLQWSRLTRIASTMSCNFILWWVLQLLGNFATNLPSIWDFNFSRPGKLIRNPSSAEVLALFAAKTRWLLQILLIDELLPVVKVVVWWLPVRKCGRENVMEPIPMTRTPKNTNWEICYVLWLINILTLSEK